MLLKRFKIGNLIFAHLVLLSPADVDVTNFTIISMARQRFDRYAKISGGLLRCP
jgi:hypothetical protein